jgi:hypothetical protein
VLGGNIQSKAMGLDYLKIATISAGYESSFYANDVVHANSETYSAGKGSGSASSIRIAAHGHQIG